MEGISKIGMFNGIPVYKDSYMSEDELMFGKGPKFPDAYYTGPAVYIGSKLVKPDGTPIENNKSEYNTRFIITGSSMRYIKKHEEEIMKQMKIKFND